MPAIVDDVGVSSAPPPRPARKAASSRPAAVQVQLHGDACVLRPGLPPWPLRGRAAALVALAALEPGIHRERAAQMLWPDAPNPRQNLRQQLLRFRQALGQALVEGDELLNLADGAALAAAPPAPAELLAGEPAGDEGFGQWLAQRRAGERQARREPLQAALAQAESAGDLDAALAQARALLTLEPQDEAHHVALMRVHYLRGEAAAGLQAYQRLVDLQRASVGSPPGPAAVQLAERLRASQTSASPAVLRGGALPVALRRPPVLAGREAALGTLGQAWQQGLRVLIEGEAGMGKSRLLAEWLPAHTPNLLMTSGRPGDSGLAYATLARLLAPALASSPGGLGPAARRALAHLGLVEAPDAQTPRPLGPNDMAHAAGELLQASGTTAVVLDDLHFADAATLELITGLAAADEGKRRWLFAQRPADAPPAARQLRDALTESGRLVVISLAPLDTAAAAAMLQAMAIPGLADEALAPALVQHTGGNPLFMLETLKQGLVDGSLSRGLLPRPLAVGGLIEQRLQRLSEPALNLARVAAISGVDFDIELAEAAIGLSAVQLASAWRELQDAQVLRDEAFAHDLVADAVLRGVPRVVARRVHAQCAAWLDRRGCEPARVARHWQQGGQALQAAQAFMQAAKRAARASRSHEAAEFQAQAAEQFEAAGQLAQAFEARVDRLNALTHGRAQDDILAEAEALHALAQTDLQRVQALRVEVDLLGKRGHTEQALAKGLPALTLAQRIGAHQELLWLATPISGCLLLQGRADEAQALLLPLQDWVEAQGDPLERARYLGLRANVAENLGRHSESRLLRERCLAIEREQGVQNLVAISLQHLAVGCGRAGLIPQAERAASEAASLCPPEERGSMREGVLLFTQARYLADLGHYAHALDLLDYVLPLLQSLQLAFWPEAASLLQAHIFVRLGQAARARAALTQADEGSPPRLRAQRRSHRLELAALQGQPLDPAWALEAQACVPGDKGPGLEVQVAVLRAWPSEQLLTQAQRLGDLARGQELFGLELSTLAWQAHAASAQGQHDTAMAAARAARALLDRGHWPTGLGRAELHMLLWQALAEAGQAGAAQQALREGVAWLQQQALPHVPPQFVESFMHRHPVHRRLLAAASRL